MAKLIAFGDSFTWGSDMADTMPADEWAQRPAEWRAQPGNRFENLYSRFTWQAKLATELGLDYKCLAVQGCSNQTVLRRFFEQAPGFQPDDVISVNFTWRDRYDFYNDKKKQWHTVRPSGTENNEYHELYYKQLHSSTWDQIESLKAINLVLDYLKMNNIKFIATCIDDLIYNDPHHCTQFMRTLQDVHRDDITWFDNKGFHEWSTDNNFPISPMWHPLEEAHEAAFKYLLSTGAGKE